MALDGLGEPVRFVFDDDDDDDDDDVVQQPVDSSRGQGRSCRSAGRRLDVTINERFSVLAEHPSRRQLVGGRFRGHQGNL